ncbi:MAG: hypothetical protein QOD82_5810, partial [Pseudonocardiales bacterium]|nr:hypothetical protein [Pseudonocardiales bacterium]
MGESCAGNATSANLTCHLEDDYYAHIQRFDSNVAHLVRARTAIEPFSACECPKP